MTPTDLRKLARSMPFMPQSPSQRDRELIESALHEAADRLELAESVCRAAERPFVKSSFGRDAKGYYDWGVQEFIDALEAWRAGGGK